MRNRLPALIGEYQVKENEMLDISTLAKRTGLSRTTLYKWVNGDLDQFRADTIEALCKFFDCQVGDLLYVEFEEQQ